MASEPKCRTVSDLRDALASLPDDAPLATLYDWQCGLRFGLTVLGVHECGKDCESDCAIVGHAVLDIDPRES